jgi:phosphonate transport system permease protein
MASVPTAAPASRFPASPTRSTFGWFLAAAFAVVLVVSVREAEVDPRVLVQGDAVANAGRFVRGMFPPALGVDFLRHLVRPLVETIQISVMGTAIAVMIGVPFGLLATASLMWRGPLHERSAAVRRALFGVAPYALARATLSVFRSIPEYVWAFMFVRAVGLGPFPAVLALGIAYGGMLGKVYSEILEGVDPRPVESLHGAGASRAAVVVYGLVPEALPHLVSYTLYRWECAIRASAILGFVGAGGIGQQLELSMRMFQFDEVLTELGVLFLLVAAADFVSARIRGRLVR